MILAPTPTLVRPSAPPQPNAVVVAGAGTAAVNGTYEQTGIFDGRPIYQFGEYAIRWSNDDQLYRLVDGIFTVLYSAPAASQRPWQVTWSDIEGAAPAPTLTPARA